MAPCHLLSIHVSSTIHEGNIKRESAVAARSRHPEIINFSPKANSALIDSLAALLLTPPDDRRLPAFGDQGQGKNKEEEGTSKRKVLVEAEGEEGWTSLWEGVLSPQ